MAGIPVLTIEEVASLVPEATHIQPLGSGGQKLVFRGTVEGQPYALKFAQIEGDGLDEIDDLASSDIARRAEREVETMRNCNSPYMVKIGPLPLRFVKHNSVPLALFSEEMIDGQDLRASLATSGVLSPKDVVQLGLQVGHAIGAIWDLGKVHRDIKPANIMRRATNGEFVLLDAGLAFDASAESISTGPVGTPAYFSPEQFDFTNRRAVLDFRSDLFSLGITMYYMGTGVHPFWSRGDGITTIYGRITSHHPVHPSELISDFPESLGDIIIRLLGKSPHLRYRQCSHLLEELAEV